MWNFQPRSGVSDITNPDNVRCPLSFTGTPDEDWFYAVSVAIEARGAAIIPAMLDCTQAVARKDDSTIVQHLQFFRTVVQELIVLLQRMNEKCQPSVFYDQIRPFLAGGKGMADSGLPRGIFYDEGDGAGSWRQYSGASNGQSALVQFLDVALGVRHGPQSSSADNYLMVPTTRFLAGNKKDQLTKPQDMRRYMRPEHAALLESMAAHNHLRPYATSAATDPAVRRAYEEAVAALILFRDAHIRIVTRYVLAPARRGKTSGSGSAAESLDELKGTGGTNLMQFLKQAREETRRVLEPVK